MLGHELRSPLDAIASAAAVLRLGTPDTTERAREVIGRQTLHLSRLVDDLLDVSQVMSGKVVLDRRPLDPWRARQHGPADMAGHRPPRSAHGVDRGGEYLDLRR
jgi:signal transduction histidine kinase